MRIEFDSAKRDKTLAERGLDFAKAYEVLPGRRIISMRKANDREKVYYAQYLG